MKRKLKFGSKAYREKYIVNKSRFKKVRYKMARRKSRKSYSRKSGGMGRATKILIGGGVSALYGAFSNDLQSKIPKIPKAENYSDNLVFGVPALAVQLLTGNKWANMIAKPISDIEIAEAMMKVRAKVPLSNGGVGSSASVNAGYI